MRKLGKALVLVMCGVAISATSPAWAIDRCRDDVSALKLAEKRVAAVEKKIDSAKFRVDSATDKLANANERGNSLIANAELQATNARATSAAVSAQCAIRVVVGLLTRNPERITYGGREYSCAGGAVRALITKLSLAEALVDRSKRKAAGLVARAQQFLDRMEARLQDYEDQLPPLVAARDQEKADLARCRAANPG